MDYKTQISDYISKEIGKYQSFMSHLKKKIVEKQSKIEMFIKDIQDNINNMDNFNKPKYS